MMSKTATRHYYAASWPYGVASNANTGTSVWNIHRFTSREVRDAWVEQRPTDYRGNSGYRSVVPSSDRDLQALLRRIARESERNYVDMSDHYLTDVPWASLAEWREAEEDERRAFNEWAEREARG